MIEAIVYLLAIALAEVVTVGAQPLWGVACHIAILMVMIVHQAMATRYPHRQLLLSLALVPLVRIISLSMPLADIPQIWWYPIIYIPLIVGAFMVMRISGYRMDEVGLTLWRLPLQLVVGLTGAIFGIAEYFILTPEPMIAGLTWQAAWLPAVMLLLFIGFGEEFIFRGVLQHSAVQAFNGRGVIYISLLFATLHMGFLSWVDVIFVFVVALFFGWVVQKTGSILGVTLAHGITNIMLYLVAPFFM